MCEVFIVSGLSSGLDTSLATSLGFFRFGLVGVVFRTQVDVEVVHPASEGIMYTSNELVGGQTVAAQRCTEWFGRLFEAGESVPELYLWYIEDDVQESHRRTGVVCCLICKPEIVPRVILILSLVEAWLVLKQEV